MPVGSGATDRRKVLLPSRALIRMTPWGDAMNRRTLLGLLIAAMLALTCGAEERPEKVRPGILGSRGWFPNDPKALAEKVDGFLAKAPEWKGAAPIAIVAPHAGYDWSGPVQASVYKSVSGRKYGRVFILGVSHRAPLRGVSIPDVTHYETPLGKVPLDREVADRLIASGPPFHSSPTAHREEHSVEIQIPFLQRTVEDLVIVPMLVSVDPSAVRAVAATLAKEVMPGDLVVASSDNCHYGENFGYRPFPEDAKIAENLRKLDMGAVRRILAMDLDGLARYKRETGITMCGFHPVCLLLALLPGGARGEVTGYDTSGARSGSYRSSVSYVGIAFTDAKWGEKPMEPPPLTTEEQKLALDLARKAMTLHVTKKQTFDPEAAGLALTEAFGRKHGVFVTLKIGGNLRGCMGDIFPTRPLSEGIVGRAISSSSQDPRFRSVTEKELGKIRLELSVLSPPREVASYDEIVLGKHGIVLLYDGRIRSVYLPQVAPEQGWDLVQTLSSLSRKGGLPADAWKTDRAAFQVFTAQVFGEDE